ncbi:hypothetical protein [Kurthia sibirica]|uniref:Lipoprotein n=1 Tax=Kurthia sibirica TaxID=202750 RepID=A0A2U3ANE4_9BACL|nr:hypothetical protein [Kurthia sibirica]PWI26026.1 hypothetical protein DEX24_05720 [Kurthia sibirica]GEK34573.1 hypothetical protein KSI01_21060 [Kurthia sibirica]
MFTIKKLLPVLLLLTLVLAACTSKEVKTTTVPDASKFNKMVIQTIVDNKAVDSKTVTIKDDKKIKEVLDAVNSKKTKEITITNTEKEMDQVDSYFVFFDIKGKKPVEQQVPYSFFITTEGVLYYTHIEINKMMTPQKTIDAQPEALKTIKKVAGIK